MQRQQLLEKYSDLFWYFDKSRLSEMSDEVMVEFILNYGTLQAVRELLDCLGTDKVAQIFSISIKKKRDNFLPQVKNYFTMLFEKHAPQYFI